MPSKDVGKGRAEVGAKPVPAAHAAMLKCSMTESVIGGALVAILQNVVRLVDFLEAVLAILIARITVRVMLHGELAERGLELDLCTGAGNAENFVVVALGHPAAALVRFAPSEPYVIRPHDVSVNVHPRTRVRG